MIKVSRDDIALIAWKARGNSEFFWPGEPLEAEGVKECYKIADWAIKNHIEDPE
jgi:hypothetical protein